MAPPHLRALRWQSSTGKDTIQCIVKSLIPAWTEGLRDWQLDLVSRILDGEDLLVSTATGDGKSAVFAIPLVVLLELQRKPLYYPDLPRRSLPMGMVITPTKGLAANIVFEMEKLGVRALAYCSEELTKARKESRHIWKEIASGEWPLVCVDPEHLTEKDWEHITNADVWRENIAFLCVDEIHLVYEWGADFRIAFRNIGMFAQSRCPSHISIFGLSATLEPGLPTSTICDTMGFVTGRFHHLHRTNERSNIHFALQTLTHTLGGDEFPDLLPLLAAGRKTVIYCETIELCWRVAVYLWGLLPPGLEKLTRVRLYHAMCWPDENEETVRLIRDEPRCQLIIATIAFAQGFNVKPLLDCVQLGVPSSMNQLVQQEGRIGRDGVSLARGVVLVQPKAIESAERFLRGHFPEMAPPIPKTNTAIKRESKSTKKVKVTQMDLSKARLLVEQGCLIALRNTVYRNPPLELTSLDCIEAERAVPCSRCLRSTNINLQFPPSPANPSLPPLVPFRSPTVLPSPASSETIGAPKKGAFALTAKMRDEITESLDTFRDAVARLEKVSSPTGRTPRAAYFPTPIATKITTCFMTITTEHDIATLIPGWQYLPRHSTHLFKLVSTLQATFRCRHGNERMLRNEKNRLRAKAKRKANKEAEDDEAGNDMPGNETIENVPPADGPSNIIPADFVTSVKRPALADDTNNGVPKRPRRAPRAPLASSTEVSQSFGPTYRPRTNRTHRTRITDENMTP